MENHQIADLFEEMADLLELQGAESYHVRSYRKAASVIRDAPRRLEDMIDAGDDLTEMQHIGDRTSDYIRQIVETGTCDRLEELREDVPEGLSKLMRIPGLGHGAARTLHEDAGIDDRDDLRRAAEAGEIRDLPDMGERTAQRFLRGLKMLERHEGRISIQAVEGYAESLGRILDDCDGVDRREWAGDFRRRTITCATLDVVVVTSDRKLLADAIRGWSDHVRITHNSAARLSVSTQSILTVHLHMADASSAGATWLKKTGSEAHVAALEARAHGRGWSFRKDGLFKGDRLLAARTEEAVYHRLGLDFIPPELREDRGEIEAAASGALPHLVSLADIRGDLHMHTDRTDGDNSLTEMIEACIKRGHRYIAITDHSQAMTMSHGLDEDDLRKRANEIREVAGGYDEIEVFTGVEVDIMEDGALDLEEDALAEVDWVVASIHSHLQQPAEKLTARYVQAVKSGVVHCLGHITERRIIGNRAPLEINLDAVLDACREYDVALDINAQPDRLDPPEMWIRRARDAGVRFVTGTDAHKIADLDFMHFGVDLARRGWLEKGDLLNTLGVANLRRHLEGR